MGLSSSIRGDILHAAVNATLRRMPYCAGALVERDGDFYYAVNPLPLRWLGQNIFGVWAARRAKEEILERAGIQLS